MGCPVPKVVNNGEGSALLKNPELIVQIIKSVSSAIQKPVTVKVRIGFENAPVDIVEIARRAEDAGAAAIAVHGRTRQQYYSGTADWDIIRQVKEAVSIPVIGNGDVDSPLKAEALLKQTGCDGVMIGRAVRGNPWIFPGDEPLFPNWRAFIQTFLRGNQGNDPAPCQSADCVKGRVYRNPGNA